MYSPLPHHPPLTGVVMVVGGDSGRFPSPPSSPPSSPPLLSSPPLFTHFLARTPLLPHTLLHFPFPFTTHIPCLFAPLLFTFSFAPFPFLLFLHLARTHTALHCHYTSFCTLSPIVPLAGGGGGVVGDGDPIPSRAGLQEWVEWSGVPPEQLFQQEW